MSVSGSFPLSPPAVVSTARSQSLFRDRMDVGSHCLKITNLLIKPLLSKKTFMRVNLSVIFSYIKSRNMIKMCMLVIFIIFLCDCFRPCLSGIYALAGPLFPPLCCQRRWRQLAGWVQSSSRAWLSTLSSIWSGSEAKKSMPVMRSTSSIELTYCVWSRRRASLR